MRLMLLLLWSVAVLGSGPRLGHAQNETRRFYLTHKVLSDMSERLRRRSHWVQLRGDVWRGARSMRAFLDDHYEALPGKSVAFLSVGVDRPRAFYKHPTDSDNTLLVIGWSKGQAENVRSYIRYFLRNNQRVAKATKEVERGQISLKVAWKEYKELRDNPAIAASRVEELKRALLGAIREESEELAQLKRTDPQVGRELDSFWREEIERLREGGVIEWTFPDWKRRLDDFISPNELGEGGSFPR